jgi:hypothetical protein
VHDEEVLVIGILNLELICDLEFVIWCFKDRIGAKIIG